MLVAATIRDGKKLIVLGLEAENIQNLLNDKPIYASLSIDLLVPGLEEWDVAILGPEDTIRFTAYFEGPES